MADRRKGEQRGAVFVPRREHARFCCVRCRAAWNREHLGDPLVEASALLWSVTAMSEATARLPQAGTGDRIRAYAVIGEAVWWVTLVDATLVRHHPEAYDAVVAGQFTAQRPLIEQTLAGLRFVRNQARDETGYQAYQAQLAGHTIGETFRRAATFLTLTAANAGSLADLANANASDGPV